jgi:hypothetical protein
MVFSGLSVLRQSLTMVALAVLAGSCTVVVDDGPRPGPMPGPQICTREYVPVCAVRDRDRQTFANGCRAEQAGYRILHRGQCRGEFGGGSSQVCTMEYRPVCARRGGTVRTFSNACTARAADFRIVGNGPC